MQRQASSLGPSNTSSVKHRARTQVLVIHGESRSDRFSSSFEPEGGRVAA